MLAWHSQARTVEVLERVANEGARLKALVRRLNDESSSAKNDLAQVCASQGTWVPRS